MCGIFTGEIGETIEIKFVFTDSNGVALDLRTYLNVKVYVYKEDGTEETNRTCTVTGAAFNEVIERFTLISPTGKKKVKIRLTKNDNKYRIYDKAIIKVK